MKTVRERRGGAKQGARLAVTRWQISATVFGCLFLASCPQAFKLTISGVSQARPIFETEEGVDLVRLTIYSRVPKPEDEAGNELPEIMWNVELSEGVAPDATVGSIQYGHLPKGFVQDVAPKPLIAGKWYQALGDSRTRGTGSVVFKILQDDDKSYAIEAFGLWQNVFGPSKPDNLIPPDLQAAADKGDSKAQYEVGMIYYHGDGVWNDHRAAYQWFEKAAVLGNRKAQYKLGLMHYSSTFLPQDKRAAFDWHMKAAEQGYPPAQVSIGLAYSLGDIVEQNDRKAFEWFVKAAAQGNISGMRYVDGKLRPGRGSK